MVDTTSQGLCMLLNANFCVFWKSTLLDWVFLDPLITIMLYSYHYIFTAAAIFQILDAFKSLLTLKLSYKATFCSKKLLP